MPRSHHVFLAALAALALCADVALAQKKPTGGSTVGLVKSVDAKAGTITLAGKKTKDGTDPVDQTLTLAKDAKVAIDGKDGKLADIKADTTASLTLAEDKKSATAVSVDGGSTAGTVKAVDAKALTITLEGKKSKKGDEPDQTVAVIKDAKVVIDGEAKALADVKAGVVVSLALTSDKKSALAVIVGGKKPGGPAGTVKAVDAKALTITLEGKKAKDGTVGEDQTVAIAKDAKVTIDGEDKTLADVKVGTQVTLALAADKKSATAVIVGGKKGSPGVGGTVKSVDATANTITLEGGNRKDGTAFEAQTISIAKDAKVTIDGAESKLADVKAGAVVMLALAADKKSATAVTVGGKKKTK